MWLFVVSMLLWFGCRFAYFKLFGFEGGVVLSAVCVY